MLTRVGHHRSHEVLGTNQAYCIQRICETDGVKRFKRVVTMGGGDGRHVSTYELLLGSLNIKP